MNAILNHTPKQSLNPSLWIEEHRDRLVRFALRKVSGREIAEDLVQDTFVAAWKAKDRFRGDCAESTFLTSILRNKIADHYRRAHTRLSVNASDLENDEVEGTESWLDRNALEPSKYEPSSIVERGEFLNELKDAVAKLPESMGRVYEMRELQGRSTEEITKTLKISKSNLWVLAHRARHALREQLGEDWSPSSSVVAA